MKTQASLTAEQDLELRQNVRGYVAERIAEVIEAKDINLIVSEGKKIAAQLERGSKFEDILKEAQELLRKEYKRLYAKGFRPGQTSLPESVVATEKLAPVGLPTGTFTVERADGRYETIRIEQVTQGALAGKFIASYMSGPDNDRDFQGFAFVDPRSKAVHVWKRCKDINPRWISAIRVVLGTEDHAAMREAYAMRSGRCSRCGRTLTVPASLHRGLGPECATKV